MDVQRHLRNQILLRQLFAVRHDGGTHLNLSIFFKGVCSLMEVDRVYGTRD